MKARWLVRIQPFVGALILLMGLMQTTLLFLSEKRPDMRGIASGLLMCGGGVGMIHRRTRLTIRFWGFVGFAVLTTAAVVLASGKVKF